MIVYEIMTCEELFKNCNFYQVMTLINDGYRPPFKYLIPYCYRKLIEHCWQEEPRNRPSFIQIVKMIRNNPDFITQNIDKNEFLDYVAMIDESQNNHLGNIQPENAKKVLINAKGSKENYETLNDIFLDINKYERGDIINKNDFFKHFKIKDIQTKNVFIAKSSMLKIKQFTYDEMQELSNKLKVISDLNHYSLLKFIGYSPIDFKKESKPIIVTEYASNGTLNDILNMERNNVSINYWNDTKKIINIYGIASGMAYLHSFDIVHRDLKPENIFLDDFLFPKIGDFGLSNCFFPVDSITHQSVSAIKANPIYSAPEVLESNLYTKSSDVYAFAFIVYEIITSNIPCIQDSSNKQIFSEIIVNGKTPEIDENVPNCYKDLIEKCWSQNPNERPSFEEIVFNIKENGDFTNKINKKEFVKYVKMLEKSQKVDEINSQNVEYEVKNNEIQNDNDNKVNNQIYDNDMHAKDIKISEIQKNVNEVIDFDVNINENQSNNDDKINNYINDDEKNCTNANDNEISVRDINIIKNQNSTNENDEIQNDEASDHYINISENKDNDDSEKYSENSDKNHSQSKQKDELISELISLKNARDLMKHLNENCTKETTSKVFDRCFIELPDLYLNICKEGIKLENPVAYHKYALYLIYNNSDENRLERCRKARSYLNKAIDKGYNLSYFSLAHLLHEFFNEDDIAFKKLEEGSKKDEIHSKCLLGYFIAHGIGTKKDHKKGVEIILESQAEDLYECFATDIGIYYANSTNNINDCKSQEAFKWFEKAFQMKYTNATINNYGICFMKGIGTNKNIEKAKEIFSVGVNKGYSDSYYHMAFILKDFDPISSLNYYKKAAENARAQFYYAYNLDTDQSIQNRHEKANLGFIFESDKQIKSIDYYKKAIKSGIVESTEFLAVKFSVENDSENTVVYMNDLIKSGNYLIPLEYAVNLYKSKHFKQAFNYFIQISKSNNPIALYFIGLMKFKGLGCEQNREESYKIMKKLSDNGIKKASDFLDANFQ